VLFGFGVKWCEQDRWRQSMPGWLYPAADDDDDFGDVTCGCFGCLRNYPSYAAVLSYRRDLKCDNITFTVGVVKINDMPQNCVITKLLISK